MSHSGETAYDVPSDVTGMRQAVTQADREGAGLPALERPVRQAMGETYDSARADIDNGVVTPEHVAGLVADTIRSPRPLSDREQSLIAYDSVRASQSLTALGNALEAAGASGDKALEAQLRAQWLEAGHRLDQNQRALYVSGTEGARALGIRNLFVSRDVGDITNVRRMATTAKGAPLTPGEDARYTALTQLYRDAQAKVDTLEQRVKDFQEGAAGRSGAGVREAVNPLTRVRGASNRLVSREEGEAAIARMKARLGSQQLSSVLGPDVLPDAIKAGAYLIEGHVRNFADWSKAMLEIHPDLTPADLQTVWTNARQELNERASKTVKPASDVLVDRLAQRLGRAGATQMVNNLNDQHPGLLDKLLAGQTLSAQERGAIADEYRSNTPARGTAPAPLAAMKAVTDAVKETSDTARVNQQIAALQEELRTGKPAAAARPERTVTPELQALLDQRDALSKQAQGQRAEPRRLAAINAQIADLQKQLDANTFTPQTPRTPKPLSDALQKATAERNRLQQQIQDRIADQRPKTFADHLLRWQRMSLLSGVSTLGKLAAAATGRIAVAPIEEMIGAAVPGPLAAKAPVEGKFVPAAEVAALRKVFSRDTLTDMAQKVRTGSHSLDALYGEGEHNYNPYLDFFGGLHGMIKTPAQRAAFGRAFEKIARSLPAGTDTTDPAVQMQVGTRAYLESKRAIFMNDNAATDMYKSALRAVSQHGPAGRAVATGARALMPIVKVPTNYVGEVGHYVGGLPEGLARLIAARGVENMTPEQADATMRAFKKGALGAGLMALGAYGYKNGTVQASGYYEKGQETSGLKPGEVRIAGVTIPHTFLHVPAVEALQWGATLMRAWEHTKGEASDKLGHGLFTAGVGTAEQLPFLEQPIQAAKALQSEGNFGKFAGKLAQTVTEPQILQQGAAYLDRDAAGHPVARAPRGFREQMKMGIPGARQQVPVKQPKGGGRSSNADPMRVLDNVMRLSGPQAPGL